MMHKLMTDYLRGARMVHMWNNRAEKWVVVEHSYKNLFSIHLETKCQKD